MPRKKGLNKPLYPLTVKVPPEKLEEIKKIFIEIRDKYLINR